MPRRYVQQAGRDATVPAMSARRPLAVLAILLTALAGPATGGNTANAAASTMKTDNWAGEIALTTKSQSSVIRGSSIEYQVPKVSCSPNENSKAAVWTGIGGWVPGDTLYQAGTTSACDNGAEKYTPWFEVENSPKGAFDFKGGRPLPHSVSPGDWVSIAIVVSYSPSAQAYVTNFSFYVYGPGSEPSSLNTLWSQQFNLPYYSNTPNTRSSECVVERPFGLQGNRRVYAQLSNFGTIAMNCGGYQGDELRSGNLNLAGRPWQVTQASMWNGKTQLADIVLAPGLYGVPWARVTWKAGR